MKRSLSFDSLEHRRLCDGDANWDIDLGWLPNDGTIHDPGDVLNHPTFILAPPNNPLTDPTVYPHVYGLNPLPKPNNGDLLIDPPY